MGFPAFKEWQVIVQALRAGDQILILRKGGIAEGRGGFQVQAETFWLYPTRFHAQQEKTKPAAHAWITDVEAETLPSPTVELSCFARIVASRYLTAWEDVARLDPFHLWTEETVRERFQWSREPGVHALVVRVQRLDTPVLLTVTPEMGGCKSWIEVDVDPWSMPAAPALSDAAFADRRARLGL